MSKETPKVKVREVNLQEAKDIDKGYAWVVLAATFSAFFICGAFLLTTGIVHTALLAKFKATVAKTSWAGSVSTAAMSLTAPVGSAIVDRFSCRVAVMVGSGLITVGFLLTGLAPSIEFCIFSYGFVTGLGVGIAFTPLFVVNGFNFKDRLSLAQGIALSGTGCGLFVCAPVFEACKAEFGYTGFFFILAGLAMQLNICGALMRPSSLESRTRLLRNSYKKKGKQTLRQKYKYSMCIYKKALCNGYAMLLSASMFFFCGGVYSMFLHWPNFCAQRGFTAMQSSYVLSVVGFVSIAGRLGSGIVASLRNVGERIVYSGSMVVLGISLVLFFLYSKSFSGHLALAVIVGLTNGSPYVVITALTAFGVGLQFLAATVGIEFWFGGIGTILTPVLSGYLIHAGFSYELTFVLCGLCLLLSAGFGFGTKFVKTAVPLGDSAMEIGSNEITTATTKDILEVAGGTQTDVIRSPNAINEDNENTLPLITETT